VKLSAIRLRPCQRSDFESLYHIDQACFPPGIAYGRTELNHYLLLQGALCMLAEADGVVGGFIVSEQSAEMAHIITLDVLENFRRQGIGTRLLRAAEEAASSRGARLIVLETATTNKPAIALWTRHGYREAGRHKNYYGPGLDALEMHKLLKQTARGEKQL